MKNIKDMSRAEIAARLDEIDAAEIELASEKKALLIELRLANRNRKVATDGEQSGSAANTSEGVNQ